MICTNCYFRGKPDKKTKGNFLIEIILWFFFLIPGLIYTIWRHNSKVDICPHCERETLIPEDSLRGQDIIKKHLKSKDSENLLKKVQSEVKDKRAKRHNNTLKVIAGIVAFFLFIGFLGNLADESAEQNKGEQQTPVPISEEHREQLAQTFCEKRSEPYVRSVNLDDFLLMYENAGETITLRPELGKPSEENCTEVIDLCLSIWNENDCDRIAEQKIWLGMEKDQLILSWGLPNDRNNTVVRGSTSSQWVYGDFGPYVYLEGADSYDLKVTSWQD